MKNFEEFIKIINIAKECHLKNNELMLMNGEVPLTDDWYGLDDHTKNMSIKSVIKILNNPEITAKDLHDEWISNKIKDGWIYGEEKNLELKTHPSIIDFESLNDIDKLKDQYFIDVVNKYR